MKKYIILMLIISMCILTSCDKEQHDVKKTSKGKITESPVTRKVKKIIILKTIQVQKII